MQRTGQPCPQLSTVHSIEFQEFSGFCVAGGGLGRAASTSSIVTVVGRLITKLLSERDFKRGGLAVHVAQVSVDFHSKGTAV